MSRNAKIPLFLFTSILLLFTIFWLTPVSLLPSSTSEEVFTFSKHQEHNHDAYYVNDSENQENDSWPENPVVDDKDVVVLTGKNFSDFITTNQYVMVEFYASWCFWSRKLAPEYSAAATLLKGEAVLAKVEAGEERELGRKYRIQGYPTLKLFVGGIPKASYYGERTRDAIATWMRQKTGLVVQILSTTEEAERVPSSNSAVVKGFLDTLEDVVVLTQKNFSDFVAANQYVMLNFYAPWCVWSQKLAPEYSNAATMLKGEVVFASIDATDEIELGKMFKIKEYPTIYLLINGGIQNVTYGSGDERSSDAIATWVRQKMSPVVQNVITAEEAERILAARSALVMGFFDTLEGSESEELAAVAKQHIDVNFYQTADAEVARLFQIDQQIKHPGLVMLKRRCTTANHSHFAFDGEFTGSEISNFISENKLPSVITFTEEDAPNILKNPMKQLWLFASTYSEVLTLFVESADHFNGKLLFVHVETGYSSMQSRISYEFGIAEGLPTLVAYMANGADKHVYDSDLSFNGIKAFAEQFLEDQLPSQPSSTPDEVIRLPFHIHNSGPTSTGLAF